MADGMDTGADPGTAGCDDGVEFMKLPPGAKTYFAPYIKNILAWAGQLADAR